MWKKIHVELEFLRLNFHFLRLEFHFFLAFFWVPSIAFIFVQIFLCSSSLRQIVPLFVSILRLFIRSFLCSSAFFVSSSRLFVLPRCLRPDHPPSCWRSDHPPVFFSNQIAHPALDRLLRRCTSSTPTWSPTQHQIISILHLLQVLFFF